MDPSTDTGTAGTEAADSRLGPGTETDSVAMQGTATAVAMMAAAQVPGRVLMDDAFKNDGYGSGGSGSGYGWKGGGTPNGNGLGDGNGRWLEGSGLRSSDVFEDGTGLSSDG